MSLPPSAHRRAIPDRLYFQSVRTVPELQRDCPNLYVCQDFMKLVPCWQNDPLGVPLFGKASIRTAHCAAELAEPTEAAATLPAIAAAKQSQALLRSVAPSAVRFRINVKMALFSGLDIAESAFLEKDDASLNRLIHFLVLKAVNKDQIFLVGGQFGLVADLQSVSNAMLIGKLVYRFVLFSQSSEFARAQLGVDLSACQRWVRMMDVWYHRTETSRGEKCDYDEVTVVFLPDLFYRSPAVPTLLRALTKEQIAEKKVRSEAKKEPPTAIVEVGEIVRTREAQKDDETPGQTPESRVDGSTEGEIENSKENGTESSKEGVMEEEGKGSTEGMMEEEKEEKERKETKETGSGGWSEAYLKSQTVPTLRQWLRERTLLTRVAPSIAFHA